MRRRSSNVSPKALTLGWIQTFCGFNGRGSFAVCLVKDLGS